MSEPTPRDTQFIDLFSGFFHDLLRAAGVTMLPNKSHEKIREVATKLATTIELRAADKVRELVSPLVKSLVDSFEKVQADVDGIRARLDALEKKNEDPS